MPANCAPRVREIVAEPTSGDGAAADDVIDASDSQQDLPTVVLGGNATRQRCVLSADQASHFCGMEDEGIKSV